MTESSAWLAEKLKSEGERLATFFATLHDDQWNKEVYTEGAVWSVRNVLAHLTTAEHGFNQLFASVQQGGPGVSEDFSIDRYNARQQERTRDLAPLELLEQFRAGRAEMIAWVASLEEADLEKTGRHPFLGLATLREMIKMVYIHNQLHYRYIKRALW